MGGPSARWAATTPVRYHAGLTGCSWYPRKEMRPIPEFLPCDPLVEILSRSFQPCPGFTGGCRASARWAPDVGHVPRGFVGALGSRDDVKLIIVTAEPGDPRPGECQQVDPDNLSGSLAHICEFTYRQLETRFSQYHGNVRTVLDLCWPGLDLRSQMTRTWIHRIRALLRPSDDRAGAARARVRRRLPRRAACGLCRRARDRAWREVPATNPPSRARAAHPGRIRRRTPGRQQASSLLVVGLRGGARDVSSLLTSIARRASRRNEAQQDARTPAI